MNAVVGIADDAGSGGRTLCRSRLLEMVQSRKENDVGEGDEQGQSEAGAQGCG